LEASVLTEDTAFLIALAALLIGTAAGFLVQRVAISIRKDTEWADYPEWKKWSLSATGSIAAFAAGAYVLSHAPTFSPDGVRADLWLWQTLAAWMGPTLLDLGAQLLTGTLQKKGG